MTDDLHPSDAPSRAPPSFAAAALDHRSTQGGLEADASTAITSGGGDGDDD